MEQNTKPFNGHTPLPWDVKDERVHGYDAKGPTMRIVRYMFHDNNRSGRSFKPILESPAGFASQADDIAFAHHAINTYYTTQAELASLRAENERLIEAGTRLMERAKFIAGDAPDAKLDDLAENFLTVLSTITPTEQ